MEKAGLARPQDEGGLTPTRNENAASAALACWQACCPLYTEGTEREKRGRKALRTDRAKMAKAGGALAREEKLWYNHTAKRGPAPGEERVGPYDPDQ